MITFIVKTMEKSINSGYEFLLDKICAHEYNILRLNVVGGSPSLITISNYLFQFLL